MNALRNRQLRNLLTSLLLAPGVPMLLMGDEVRRSQGGNNNTWCQNNPLGWMHWQPRRGRPAPASLREAPDPLRQRLGTPAQPEICPLPTGRPAGNLDEPHLILAGMARRRAAPSRTGPAGPTAWPGASTTPITGP